MEIMKVILLTGVLIEFTVHQPTPDSVKLSYIYSGHQKGQQSRRRLNSPKPNYGYEAYWHDSDWVFPKYEPTTEGDKKISCTKVFCPLIFIKYGEICAQNAKFTHKTFDNYCEMQNEDCTGSEDWMLAYQGKCVSTIKTYPTEKYFHSSRAMGYIADLKSTSTTEGP